MQLTTLEGNSGTVSFAPRARLMKLIGGELVSDEVVAVTELVKNAYDADASVVRVRFTNVAAEGGEIEICDDGHGMSLEEIATYWMQPGGTTKLNGKSRQSAGGRRVLGEKGIGRFAVDKLGSGLVLTSRKMGQKKEVLCQFDWSEFEHETRMLGDVKCAWEVRSSQSLQKPGTVLRITGLRSAWNERLFRKLTLRLGRLKLPFDTNNAFRIIVESDEFPDYSGELHVDYLKRAPHKIEAHFDGDQTFTMKVAGKARRVSWNGSGSLACGPLNIRLFAYDLETPSISSIGPVREVRAWLREWTGVSVFRDGFRISPYGEPHDDWLRLDQRRVNNPVLRLSNNQIVGFVEIGRESNADLIDQTNREGMISNKAFADLREAVLLVMAQLEMQRQAIRHPSGPGSTHQSSRTESKESDTPTHVEELTRLAMGRGTVAARDLKALADQVAAREKLWSERNQALMAGYSELAAIGQVAEGVAMRLNSVLERLDETLAQHQARLPAGVRGLLEDARSQVKLLDPVTTRHGHAGGRRTIDLVREIKKAVEFYQPRMGERGISLEFKEPRTLYRVEIGPENFHRVMATVLDNAMEWTRSAKKPTVRIEVSAERNRCQVRVQDNGSGIPEDMATQIFEPLVSGREGGRGLGLAIARDLVTKASGFIEAVADRRRTGATIVVELPRKRLRATRS